MPKGTFLGIPYSYGERRSGRPQPTNDSPPPRPRPTSQGPVSQWPVDVRPGELAGRFDLPNLPNEGQSDRQRGAAPGVDIPPGFWVNDDKRSQNRTAAFSDPFREGNQARLADRLTELEGRTDPRSQLEFREGQADLIAALKAQAEGRGGPSVAETQLRYGTNRTMAGSASLMNSARGVAPGLAARMALRQQGSAMQDAAGQGAILRAQETTAAREQLAGVLGQARGQDAQIQAQVDDLTARYVAAGLEIDAAQTRAWQDMERLTTEERTQRRGQDKGAKGGMGGLAGPIIGAAATLGSSYISSGGLSGGGSGNGGVQPTGGTGAWTGPYGT